MIYLLLMRYLLKKMVYTFFDLIAEVKSKYENYNVYIEMKLSGERRFVLDYVNRINRKDFKIK